MIDDERLDELLHAASPARTPLTAKPDADALAMLERIMSTDPRPHRTRNRLLGFASAAVAVVMAAALGISVLTPSGQAIAGTPPPLAFEGEASVESTVGAAQKTLADSPGPSEPQRFVRSATWSLNIDGDTGATTVVPQLVTLQWEADQSGRVVVVDGDQYDPADAAANASARVSTSGKVSMDLTMKPGEFTTPVATPPGSTRESLVGALQALGMPAQASAADVTTAMGALLEQWTLTNRQEAELLAILGESEGVTALGRTTDRLGRPVAGMRVVSADGAASDVILLSLETGRIVGIERTNVTENEYMPAGAVIGYRLLDVDGFVR
ncbi:hypothetical protein AB663_002766 [Microbacterium sp. XT11]|nr:hypothetical protein AB663_002766 [Microbacterium sp. XT11]